MSLKVQLELATKPVLPVAEPKVVTPEVKAITSSTIREFLQDEYRQRNCCPVIQKALDRITNVKVTKQQTTITFSNKGGYQVPLNSLEIISRDVKAQFFKGDKTYFVKCVNLKH